MAETASPGLFRSVRHRLLLPMLVVLLLFLGTTMLRWTGKVDDRLMTKVNSDLTVARQYLERILETTDERAQGGGEKAKTWRRALGLDYLYLLDAEGRVMGVSPVGARPPPTQPGLRGTAIDILPHAVIAALSPDLAARARLDLVPTENAVPTDRASEDRGMVV
ncbi:hypothetical protein [Neotabrizicola sp. sgz301269]|uniref:hypothetical protein n=1 Tax=Neotabrizicola sp. sgz301269 TaxID=3276282 RepID=UPI00376FA811